MIGAAAALLLALAAQATTGPAPEGRYSLILFTTAGVEHRGSAHCPEQATCGPGRMELLRLEAVRVVSGPPVPERIEVLAFGSVDPPRDLSLRTLAVRPVPGPIVEGPPHWEGVWLPRSVPILPHGGLCVPTASVRSLGIAIPTGSRNQGDETCFTL